MWYGRRDKAWDNGDGGTGRGTGLLPKPQTEPLWVLAGSGRLGTVAGKPGGLAFFSVGGDKEAPLGDTHATYVVT
jgi:hypothetical protein